MYIIETISPVLWHRNEISLHCSITIIYFPRHVLPVLHINEQSGKKKQAFDISKKIFHIMSTAESKPQEASFFLSKELFTYIVGVNGSRKGQNYVLMHCFKYAKKWTWCCCHIKNVALYYGKATAACLRDVHKAVIEAPKGHVQGLLQVEISSHMTCNIDKCSVHLYFQNSI